MTGGSQEATGTPRDESRPTADPEAGAAATAASDDTIDETRFAHHSEAEMARILDFYQVRWEYEPTTFPILWNLDGDVVESFAPDFYLPDLEVYLEMTTLRQRLVRKKNRKLRRLRELYPDIRIKLFYARDFRAMMLKYGRLGLAESLSGTPGQVVPARAAAQPASAAAAEPVAGASAEPGAGEPPIAQPVATAQAARTRKEVPLPADTVAAELASADDQLPGEDPAAGEPITSLVPLPATRSRSGRRRRRRSEQVARLAAEREATG